MKKMTLLLLSMSMLLLTACNLGHLDQEPEYEKGSLVLNLGGGSNAKAIMPTESLDIGSYDISGTGPDGETFSDTNVTGSTYTRTNIRTGEWSFTINGLNGEDTVIVTSTIVGKVEIDKVNIFNITLLPLEGEGILDIKITLPKGLGDLNAQVLLIDPYKPEGSMNTIIPSIMDNNILTSTYNVSAGSYFIKIDVKNDNDTVWGMVDSVRIIASSTSSADETIPMSALQGSDIPTFGDIEFNVDSETYKPVELTLNGVVDTLTAGETMGVSITNSNPINPIYIWYLNNEIISQGNVNIVAVGNGLSTGHYRLSLLVVDGLMTSSTYEEFDVVDAPINDLSNYSNLGYWDASSYGLANNDIGGFAAKLRPAQRYINVFNKDSVTFSIDNADIYIKWQLSTVGKVSFSLFPKNSWSGSILKQTYSSFFAVGNQYPVSSNKWYYTHYSFDSEGNYTHTVSINNYDDQGGIVVEENANTAHHTGTIPKNKFDLYKKQIDVQFAFESEASHNAYFHIDEVLNITH